MSYKQIENIKIIALGGVGEIGKNMYVVEVDDEVYIMDAGLMFPENEMLGIDIVIPDISYIIEKKDNVKGIFLSHGHEDHIGALPYILRKLNAPIYGTKLTIELVKASLKEHSIKEFVKFNEITSDSYIEFDKASVSFFRTNHSIPESVGITIHTVEGSIVYTSDFKFDQAASKDYKAEIGKMAQIGEKGVLCLLSDSTGAEKPGYTPSESIVANEMSSSFHSSKGRVIVACFASDINIIQHVFNAAYENNRKVAVVGRSLQKVYGIAMDLGYLKTKEDLIVPIADINKYDNDETVILATGFQGEPLEVLQKMAKQNHRYVNIQKGDAVLIAASPIRGSELLIYKTIDMIYRAGATVVSNYKKIHVSGHGSQEELKMMINLMNPSYFIPVHGEHKMLHAHKKIAKSTGMDDSQIFLIEKGDIIEYKQGAMRYSGRVNAGHVLIDGIGVGDVGNIVLRDRRLLSQDGIFIVVVTLNKHSKNIAAGPEIISRGFVYVRESEKLLVESTNIVREIVENNISRDTFDWTSLKQNIRDQLNHHLYEKTKRRPMILPIIMEI